MFDRVFGKYSEFAKDDFDYDPGPRSRGAGAREDFGSLREISISISFVEAARGVKKTVDLIYDVSGRENGISRDVFVDVAESVIRDFFP